MHLHGLEMYVPCPLATFLMTICFTFKPCPLNPGLPLCNPLPLFPPCSLYYVVEVSSIPNFLTQASGPARFQKCCSLIKRSIMPSRGVTKYRQLPPLFLGLRDLHPDHENSWWGSHFLPHPCTTRDLERLKGGMSLLVSTAFDPQGPTSILCGWWLASTVA